MNLVEHYDNAFRRLGEGVKVEYSPNSSLLNFLKTEALKRLPFSLHDSARALEIGCGHGSIFEFIEQTSWDILGLDFSPIAIEMAKNRDVKVQFQVWDIRKSFIYKDFDLIVDGHCLHCQGNPYDWSLSLENIFSSLRTGGFFILESMVTSKNMHFEGDYYYNGETLFFKELPIRRIMSARALEKSLLDQGFQIIYLRVYENRKIIPVEGRNKALSTDPDLMQVLCFKPFRPVE